MAGPPPASKGRLRLAVAAAAAVVWLAALLTLALLTANPVTVNRTQVLTAETVVVGTAEPSAGAVRLRVETTLAGRPTGDEISVAGPGAERFDRGGRYVVPLRRRPDGDSYEVALTPRPNREVERGEPLVYPATPDVIRTVESIVADRAPKPYR